MQPKLRETSSTAGPCGRYRSMSAVEYAPRVQNSTATPPITIARKPSEANDVVDESCDGELALGLVFEPK